MTVNLEQAKVRCSVRHSMWYVYAKRSS